MFIFSPHQLGISNLCIISLVRNVNIRIDKHEDAQVFQIGSFVCNSLSWKLCKNLCNCSAFLCKKAFSRFSSKLTSKFLWEILIIIWLPCYISFRSQHSGNTFKEHVKTSSRMRKARNTNTNMKRFTNSNSESDVLLQPVKFPWLCYVTFSCVAS